MGASSATVEEPGPEAPPRDRSVDDLLLASDGDTRLYLIEPDPSGFKPIASAVVLETGDNWAPLALADGKLLVRGQKQLKCLQVAQ